MGRTMYSSGTNYRQEKEREQREQIEALARRVAELEERIDRMWTRALWAIPVVIGAVLGSVLR
jgi:hypothetical protein